jgi:hypothetical protein
MQVNNMKRIFLILTLLFSTCYISFSQKSLPGKYCYWAYCLTLNNDSTFNYEYHFDLMTDLAKGKFHFINDTIFFKYDTITVYDTTGYSILGNNKIYDVKLIKTVSLTPIKSAGFESGPKPTKLYFKKDRLYYLDSTNKLIRKKEYDPFTRKRLGPYYTKIL